MPVNTDGPVGGGREEANQVKNQSGHRAVCWWQHVAWNSEWGPDNHLHRGEKFFTQIMRLKVASWRSGRRPEGRIMDGAEEDVML